MMKKLALSFIVGALVTGLAAPIAVHANYVSVYGVGKEQIYDQTGAANVSLATGSGYGFSAFAVPTDEDSIGAALITPPGSFMPKLLMGDDKLELNEYFASQSALDGAFPSGAYSFMIISGDGQMDTPATLTLSASSYPNTPQISNFAAAQDIDPESDFVLNWNAFEGGAATDWIHLVVMDEFGDTIFETGYPGQSGELNGAARSVTIPAGVLNSGMSYTAALSFAKITSRNTASFGGLGITTYRTKTRLTLQAAGSGEDLFPPVLLTSSPQSGALGVAINSVIIFSFSEPMQPIQSIDWSQNIVPANFTYTWGGGGRILTCTYAGDLPVNSAITWTLLPSGFRDLAGNQLMEVNNSGMFVTGSGQSGPTDPCNGEDDDGMGTFGVFKSLRFVQTSNGAPVLDPEDGAFFALTLVSPTNNPVQQASVTLPNGSTKNLSSFFGRHFTAYEAFNTQQQLDSAYPGGTYTLSARRADGAVITHAINLPQSGYPPTPQIANYDQTQTFNHAQEFLLQWLPFSGVTANDFLHLDLYDQSGRSFHAPDECIPRPLPNTATSIAIPGNTFASSDKIDGSLTFTKVAGYDTNSIPDIVVYAGFGASTEFEFRSSGGTPGEQPQIMNYARAANGSFQFQVKGQAGAVFVIEASSDLKPNGWSQIMTAPAPTGLLEVVDPDAVNHKHRFYRARGGN
jgi:hypothetical protein